MTDLASWPRRIRNLGRPTCGACSGSGRVPLRMGTLPLDITIVCRTCRGVNPR